MEKFLLAIDIGGTKVSTLLCDVRGVQIDRHVIRTPRGSKDDIGLALATVIDRIKMQVDIPGAELHIAVAVPEYVGVDGTILSQEVLRWTHSPAVTIARLLPKIRSRCVTVSDVRAGAVGELYFGKEMPFDSFLYVSLGTGLSSTLVIDGKPWAGAQGKAIALGEFSVFADGRDRRLEDVSSGKAIETRYHDLTQSQADGPEIDNLAMQENREARRILDSAVSALLKGIRSAIYLVDPGAVIVGGGLGTSHGYFSEHFYRAYRSQKASFSFETPLLRASLGADSTLMGCVAYAKSLVANEETIEPKLSVSDFPPSSRR